jgi:sugar lactone lactonase YvrE
MTPFGIAVDNSGTLYVADTNNQLIRKITSGGLVSTLAGSSNTGSSDGAGANASFYYPEGIAVDNAGDVYVGDSSNDTIRLIK